MSSTRGESRMSGAAVALTRDLLAMRTINPPGAEEACIRHLGAILEDGGFACDYHEYAPGRLNLVANLSGDGNAPPLCFTGHVDTVPLGTAPWRVDPFGADTEGDRLYGRGASDMKAGVAAFVIAGLELARVKNRKAGIALIITAGEETGADGARHLAAIRAVPHGGALVVAEPTSNVPLVGHKGALWLTASFKGRTAHGSMPEEGDNAIHKAARAVARLEAFRFDARAHPILGLPSLNVGTIKGGINVNSVPDSADIGIDIRTIPGQSNEAILAALQDALGPEAALAPFVDLGAVATDPAHEWVASVFAHCGWSEPRGAPYFTDASALTPAMGGAPTVILGPGEAAMAHKTDEYCLISRIGRAVALYGAIGRDWVGA